MKIPFSSRDVGVTHQLLESEDVGLIPGHEGPVHVPYVVGPYLLVDTRLAESGLKAPPELLYRPAPVAYYILAI